MRSFSGRAVLGLVAAALLVASCSSSDGVRRGVEVQEFDTDVGLGVPTVLGSAPANTAAARPVRQLALFTPRPTIPPIEIQTTPKPPCERAGPFDFAAMDAGVEPDPTVRPLAGVLPYKLDGEVITENGVQKIDDFEERQIRDVQDDPIAPSAFRYTMVQTRLVDERANSGRVETTFQVVPESPASSTSFASDTGRGLFIVSIVFKGTDTQGRPMTSTFQPSVPIKIFQFPVEDAIAIDSTGVDPTTFATLSIKGSVKGKKQVDACGERVDTWFVDAQQRFQYNEPGKLQTQTIDSNYDYGVAPQFGSILLFEHVVVPPEGPIVSIDARVARVPGRTGGGS